MSTGVKLIKLSLRELFKLLLSNKSKFLIGVIAALYSGVKFKILLLLISVDYLLSIVFGGLKSLYLLSIVFGGLKSLLLILFSETTNLSSFTFGESVLDT